MDGTGQEQHGRKRPDLAELLARHEPTLAERRERLTRFWAGKDLGRPPLSFIPHQFTPRQVFKDDAVVLQRAARYFERILQLPGDTIPAFWPDQGTISLASTFGGELVLEDGDAKRWIRPALSSLEEVAGLEPPEPLSALVRKEFDLCRRFRDLSGGRGSVTLPDPQGPVNIAALVMDPTELLIGMYTEPELVRRLLRLCTDLILRVFDAYRQEFGELFVPVTWPHVWLPPGMGMALTQDSAPMLSPQLHREFELPLVQEIARHAGGLYVHCCGTFEHVLDAMAEIPGLRGIDHAYPESNAETILDRLGPEIVLTSGVSSRGQPQFPRYEQYLEYLQLRLPEHARLWVVLPDTPEGALPALTALGLDRLREQYEAVPPDADSAVQ